MPPDLAREFRERGPWVTRFVIDGCAHGGDYDPAADARTAQFRERFGRPGRVLELGSLEGGFSFALGPHAGRWVALEGRESNIARAEFVRGLLGMANVEFHRVNLETADLTAFGRFDVVFCVGVLYHLPRPWELVRRMAGVSDSVFLWSHYAPPPHACRDGHAGRLCRENGHDDPLGGLSPVSFWLSRDALLGVFGRYFSATEIVHDDTQRHALTGVFRK